MTVVRAFYENVKETIGLTSMVWEKIIKFDGTTTNKFYNILISTNDDLSDLASSNDMDEMV